MGQKPVEVKDLFALFDENFVLTSLTHSADAKLLKLMLSSSLTICCVFIGNKVSEKSILVKGFFQIFFSKISLTRCMGAWYNEATPPWGGRGVAQTVPTRYL